MIIRITAAPMSMRTPPVIFKRGSSTPKIMDAPPAPSMDKIATHFVRRLMHRPVSQFRIIGPNSLLLSSHACHFSEDLAKNHADSNRNGVPGNIGKTKPNIASARKKKPNGLRKDSFIDSFLFCLLAGFSLVKTTLCINFLGASIFPHLSQFPTRKSGHKTAVLT